jgi:hypothetical protein
MRASPAHALDGTIPPGFISGITGPLPVMCIVSRLRTP